MQKYIYVLKLENEKWFIYDSEEKPERQIMNECEIYYDYAKKHKPIHLEEIIPWTNSDDRTTHVKEFMYLYGVSNVKGGPYMEDPLPEYLEKTLKWEINQIENDIEDENKRQFSEILEKYQYRIYDSLEEINSEIQNIKDEFQKYISEKERWEKMKFFNEDGIQQNSMDFSSEDIKWLYEWCCMKTFQRNLLQKMDWDQIERNLKSNEVKKYKKLLGYFKHLFRTFEEFDLFSKHSIEKKVELKYPQFVFDSFIYDLPNLRIQEKDEELSEIKGLCDIFQYMGDILYNHVSELEFDVSSYGSGFEWKVPRIIYILERKNAEFENLTN
jgi:hypothetical protein